MYASTQCAKPVWKKLTKDFVNSGNILMQWFQYATE